MSGTFKKGDKVIMEGCAESTLHKYKGRIWTCQTDSYIDKCGQDVVFLEGFSGCFMCKYLKLVTSPAIEQMCKESELASKQTGGNQYF